MAYSKKGKISKVGYAKHADLRLVTMNKTRYAGFDDWELKVIYECEKIGQVESRAHTILAPDSYSGTVYFNGKSRYLAREVFSCGHRRAINALEKAIELVFSR